MAAGPGARWLAPALFQVTADTEPGTSRRFVTYRPNSRLVPTAWTRKVTVAHIICGVDVSAETLDARIGRDGAWQQFDRTTGGIAQLAQFCKSHQVSLVVMEATGGYERLPFAQVCGAGMPVAIVNPRSVRRFAEAMGALEKTDKIDSGMIAWYAETRRIELTPLAIPTNSSASRLWFCGGMRQRSYLRNRRKQSTPPGG